MPDQSQVKPEAKNLVLHATLTIGDAVLMASDVTPDRFQPMRSAYISLSVDSDAEAERIFGALSKGGEVFMPMGETFFASRFAMMRDRFGISWMVIHEKPMG
jgi:PhnB protein